MNKQNYVELAAFLRNFQTVLDNVKNEPLITHRLAPFGYDEAHLAEGYGLLTDLQTLDGAQSLAYGDKEATYRQLEALLEEADSRYGWHRNLAKRLLPVGSNGRRALRLNERKARQRTKWLRQATVFYRNLLTLPDLLNTFARYNQTAAVLQEALQKVETVAQLDGHAARCKALAEEATRQRNLKWKEGRAWLAVLLVTAKLALREEPQLLEAFQIVRSSPTIQELIEEESFELPDGLTIEAPSSPPNMTFPADPLLKPTANLD